MTACEWKPGDRCRVVEHDDATRKPRENGRVIPATVASVAGPYVRALPDEGEVPPVRPVTFWAESGWPAWDGEFRWRLLPTEDEAAPAAGEGKGNG